MANADILEYIKQKDETHIFSNDFETVIKLENVVIKTPVNEDDDVFDEIFERNIDTDANEFIDVKEENLDLVLDSSYKKDQASRTLKIDYRSNKCENLNSSKCIEELYVIDEKTNEKFCTILDTLSKRDERLYIIEEVDEYGQPTSIKYLEVEHTQMLNGSDKIVADLGTYKTSRDSLESKIIMCNDKDNRSFVVNNVTRDDIDDIFDEEQERHDEVKTECKIDGLKTEFNEAEHTDNLMMLIDDLKQEEISIIGDEENVDCQDSVQDKNMLRVIKNINAPIQNQNLHEKTLMESSITSKKEDINTKVLYVIKNNIDVEPNDKEKTEDKALNNSDSVSSSILHLENSIKESKQVRNSCRNKKKSTNLSSINNKVINMVQNTLQNVNDTKQNVDKENEVENMDISKMLCTNKNLTSGTKRRSSKDVYNTLKQVKLSARSLPQNVEKHAITNSEFEAFYENIIKNIYLNHPNGMLVKSPKDKSVYEQKTPDENNLKINEPICEFDVSSSRNKKGKALTNIKGTQNKVKEPFTCKDCSYRTCNKKDFNTHKETHSNVTKCRMCNYVSNQRRSLASHMKVHSKPEEKKMLKCTCCNFEASNTRTLNRHLLLHKSPKGLNEVQCDVCPLQSKQRREPKTHNYGLPRKTRQSTKACHCCTNTPSMRLRSNKNGAH